MHFDRFSHSVSQNPVNTTAVLVSDDMPWNGDISVQYGDSHYAIKPDDGYPWNREAFRLLCQLFQMTMADLAQQGAPKITISK